MIHVCMADERKTEIGNKKKMQLTLRNDHPCRHRNHRFGNCLVVLSVVRCSGLICYHQNRRYYVHFLGILCRAIHDCLNCHVQHEHYHRDYDFSLQNYAHRKHSFNGLLRSNGHFDLLNLVVKCKTKNKRMMKKCTYGNQRCCSNCCLCHCCRHYCSRSTRHQWLQRHPYRPNDSFSFLMMFRMHPITKTKIHWLELCSRRINIKQCTVIDLWIKITYNWKLFEQKNDGSIEIVVTFV